MNHANTIAELLHPSGVLRFARTKGIWYDRTHAGGGLIECSKAPLLGIDENLFGVLKVLVDSLLLHIVVNSVDTGRHATNSRHYAHLAADINKIALVGEKLPRVTILNEHTFAVVHWLLGHGFRIGEGAYNPGPGLLLGPIGSVFNPSDTDHSTHLHMSLGRR